MRLGGHDDPARTDEHGQEAEQEHGGRIAAPTAKLSEAEQEATARDDPERGPVATGRVHVELRCKPEQEACGTCSEQCR